MIILAVSFWPHLGVIVGFFIWGGGGQFIWHFGSVGDNFALRAERPTTGRSAPAHCDVSELVYIYFLPLSAPRRLLLNGFSMSFLWVLFIFVGETCLPHFLGLWYFFFKLLKPPFIYTTISRAAFAVIKATAEIWGYLQYGSGLCNIVKKKHTMILDGFPVRSHWKSQRANKNHKMQLSRPPYIVEWISERFVGLMILVGEMCLPHCRDVRVFAMWFCFAKLSLGDVDAARERHGNGQKAK